MRSEGNVYNPVPERMPKIGDADELAQMEMKAIEQACDIRLHRSFFLPPNPKIGRTEPIRVTYSDVGFRTEPEDQDSTRPEQDSEDIPAVLWCGGMFGGRYQAFADDELAQKYRVRFLAIDRPGIGGTGSVPLEQRVATWLDMLPAFLEHLGIKHVHLAAHSAGTIFVMNTILHQRHLLHPTKPYIAMFGPWVHPEHSGNWGLATVSKLPAPWIGTWHHIAKFVNSNIAPVIAASGMAITKVAKANTVSSLVKPSLPGVGESPDEHQSKVQEEWWRKASESVITKYVFEENVDGASQEALLCLKKGGATWGDWDRVSDAVARIAENEKARSQSTDHDMSHPLRVQLFFAEEDEMIGKGGQKYLESCFANVSEGGLIDFSTDVIPGTDHNDVCSVQKGAIEKLMKAIGTEPAGAS